MLGFHKHNFIVIKKFDVSLELRRIVQYLLYMYCLLLCFVLSDILFHLSFSYSKQKTKYTKGF